MGMSSRDLREYAEELGYDSVAEMRFDMNLPKGPTRMAKSRQGLPILPEVQRELANWPLEIVQNLSDYIRLWRSHGERVEILGPIHYGKSAEKRRATAIAKAKRTKLSYLESFKEMLETGTRYGNTEGEILEDIKIWMEFNPEEAGKSYGTWPICRIKRNDIVRDHYYDRYWRTGYKR